MNICMFQSLPSAVCVFAMCHKRHCLCVSMCAYGCCYECPAANRQTSKSVYAWSTAYFRLLGKTYYIYWICKRQALAGSACLETRGKIAKNLVSKQCSLYTQSHIATLSTERRRQLTPLSTNLGGQYCWGSSACVSSGRHIKSNWLHCLCCLTGREENNSCWQTDKRKK